PHHVPAWLSLAAALRALGRRAEELAALERGLAVDPQHLILLLQKAGVLDLMDKPRAAARTYANALQTLAPGARLPPPVEAHVQHARKRVAANAEALAAVVDEHIAALRQALPAGELRRFERCIDQMLGRRRIFSPQPTFMLFPHLSNY